MSGVRIGILGAGRLGEALARHCISAGHQVVIANSRESGTLAPLARRLGRSLHPATAVEAAEAGELVLLAVPFGRYCELPAGLLTGKPVVDATNYRPWVDGPYPELDLDWTTSSELIRAQLRGAKVIKAFNTMRADQVRDYGHEAGALERYGMPLAGDDDLAKRRVEDLIEQFGFDPIDTGDLANGGRRMQPGGVAYGVVLPGSQLRSRLGPPVYDRRVRAAMVQAGSGGG
ncbi:NADPH-dependent F420 reductase [Melissospora conviva]|uniref:NADPH-dependent F420 reductase n=1 Tax=Melissospora conviva TaxID=3388432 RepID=UPI003C219F9A